MVDTMDELIARVQQQVYRIVDLQEAMTGILVEETSEDGLVTVRVDGNAALVGLSFSPGISRLSPAQFEEKLVNTAHSAAYKAIERRAELVTEFNEESTR